MQLNLIYHFLKNQNFEFAIRRQQRHRRRFHLQSKTFFHTLLACNLLLAEELMLNNIKLTIINNFCVTLTVKLNL